MSYQCYDHPPLKDSHTVHGISRQTGLPVTTVIPFRMSRECEYSRDDIYADVGCVGCKHQIKPKDAK